ncbi:hypothetical protein FOA43_004633 [Brettanomyces nanus]|uniref:Uncharacterized protein n=1 Tax=Eeniella nana TaxID=13502 RepID=A0A875S795_EENNA|nr:uncharacterized protein FOA43_004633 [Brettanomyces nanus]QPG77226.1 hypothetical protein FOA43_004633 [Brettanomyces nanus]
MPYSNTIPQNESEVYATLVKIRARLAEIKKDAKYSNNTEIETIYHEVLESVTELKRTRDSAKARAKINPNTVTLPPANGTFGNQIDLLIDEIFQLLSLFFVSFGLSNTAPATHASLTTVQRLLEHLNESGVYTHQELKPIHDRLDEISDIINTEDNDDNLSTKEEIRLLKHKLHLAYHEFDILDRKIGSLPPQVRKLMDNLLSLKYQLLDLLSTDKNSKSDVRSKIEQERQVETISKDLDKLQNERDILASNDLGTAALNSSSILNSLLGDCHDYLSNLRMGEDKIDVHLVPIYDKLVNLHSVLSNLLITRRWSLRTVDLFTYQNQLSEIDKSRNAGFFGSPGYKGQSILLFLLRSCYALIYKLLESSEPVSEALQPLHNQLSTIYRCLVDLKQSGGISSMRELYPYQLKLASIDNDAANGIFKVDGQIPPGQATLTALLAECFDILHELKVDYYDKAASNGEFTETENIIGTKALQDSSYDYNNVGEQEYSSYAPSEMSEMSERSEVSDM